MKISRKGSIFRQLLLANIIVLVIPFFMAIGVYYLTINIVTAREYKDNLQRMEQVQNHLDDELDNIFGMMQYMAAKTEKSKLIDIHRYDEDLEKLYDLRKFLAFFDMTNSLVESVHIYLGNGDVVVTNQSQYNTKDTFYGSMFSYSDMNSDEWIEFIFSKYYRMETIPHSSVKNSGYDDDVMLILQTVPVDEYLSNSGIVAVQIRTEKLKSILLDSVGTSGGYAYILDENGNNIASSTNYMSEKINPQLLEGDAPSDVHIIDGHRWIVTNSISSENNWRYVMLKPEPVVLKDVYKIRKIMIIFAGLSLVVSVLLSAFMALRNSRPFKDIISALRYPDKIVNDSKNYAPYEKEIASSSEYDILERSVYKLIKQSGELQSYMKAQRPYIRRAFFEKLYSGSFNDNEELQSFLSAIGLTLNEGPALVFVVNIGGYYEYINENILREINIAKAYITDILTMLMPQNIQMLIYDVDVDKFAILLELSKIKNYFQYMEQLTNNIQKNLKAKGYKILINIGVGMPASSLINASKSYNQAIESLSRSHSDKKLLSFYANIKDDTPNYSFWYPLEIEQRLINQALCADINGINKTLDKIKKENIIEHHITLEMSQKLVENLNCTLLKLVSSHAELSDLINERSAKILKLTVDNDLIDKAIYHIRNLMLEICKYVDSNNKSKNQELIENILDYINSQYSNPQFCLSYIADHFNLNEAYFSQFFKEQIGIIFSVYIENIRMANAKTLLNQNMSINYVSDAVGYNSPHAFRRAFKRVVGVTPSNYKLNITEPKDVKL